MFNLGYSASSKKDKKEELNSLMSFYLLFILIKENIIGSQDLRPPVALMLQILA